MPAVRPLGGTREHGHPVAWAPRAAAEAAAALLVGEHSFAELLSSEGQGAVETPRPGPEKLGAVREECELVWGEPGTFVKNRRVQRKHPLYLKK